MALETGTTLGDFEIIGALGAGGMGEVYRARDTKLGREVAIKTLPASLADDKDRLARFEREAKLLASLNHAHIAAVHSLGEHGSTLYIAMELVEGQTLEEKLKSGPLPVEDALHVALQIALALEAAHDKGVVHRDLKPANVMLTSDGVVKVLDFGLAKAFSGDPNEASPGHSPALSLAMTQAGLVLGTAGYMSPEQASGQATDQRADIWSFGVVVYEMLTGQPLFSGESVPHILADVLRADPDWNLLPANLHPRIRLMLERCLDKKPRNRYHSIADARVDVEAALKDPEGGVVRALAGVAPAETPVPVHRRLLPWASALVLALAAGAAAWTLRAPEPKPVIRAVYPLAADAEIMIPDLREIAISPDGRRIAYNLADGLHVRRLAEYGDIVLPRLPALRFNPVFSADGESIALLIAGELNSSASLTLARVSASGGAPLPVVPFGATVSWGGMNWEPDGTIVYAGDNGIWRIGENGGEPELLIETEPGEQAAEPSLLPGGEWVLFSVAEGQTPDWDQARIVAESVISRERRVLRAGGSSARYAPTGHLIYAFGDVLYAAPFDAGDPALTGSPVQVVQGVRRSAATGDAQYAFSDDGTLIYVPGGMGGQNRLTLAVADRSARITRYPMPPGAYAFPRVSPDGSSAAFTATYPDGEDVVVYDLGSEAAPRRLTFGGKSRSPVWSADGTRVIYQSTRDGTASLYSQLADGSDGAAARLTTAADGETHVPESATPDGALLAYTIQGRDGTSIWILDLQTNEAEPLIMDSGIAYSQPVFSPNGRWIAYQSTETGDNEIFVQPYSPTGAKYQLPHTLDNHHPVWSPDGSELFYTPGPTQFESTPITLEPRFGFGAAVAHPNTPFNDAPDIRRRYDVMPDGSGFVGFVQESAGASDSGASLYAVFQIYAVFNWFEELKRRVPVD